MNIHLANPYCHRTLKLEAETVTDITRFQTWLSENSVDVKELGNAIHVNRSNVYFPILISLCSIPDLAPEVVSHLIDDCGCNVAKCETGPGRLLVEVFRHPCKLELVQVLLDRGAGVVGEDGTNIVHWAARSEVAVDVLEWVHRNHGHIALTPTSSGVLPVHHVSGTDAVAKVGFFSRVGADPTVQTFDGHCLLHYALGHFYDRKKIDLDLLNYLLELHGDAPGPRNAALLCYISRNASNRVDAARVLLRKWPQLLDLVDSEGHTALERELCGPHTDTEMVNFLQGEGVGPRM